MQEILQPASRQTNTLLGMHEELPQVTCPDREIALFNERHADPNGLANQLQPQLTNVTMLPGGCIQAMRKFVNRRENIDLPEFTPTCTELGKCAVSSQRSG